LDVSLLGFAMLGLCIMLLGCPFATGPTDDNAWHVSGPHIMVLLPGLDYEGISTDPHNGGPYVMYADTPYAHIMVPVSAHQED
jgi:hypothetical protein